MKTLSPKSSLMLLAATLLLGASVWQCKSDVKKTVETKPNETYIQTPEGFSVEIVAKDLGAIRHLTVSKNGDIYANRSVLKDGKAIILLKDIDKDGTIDEQKQFADEPGTGILSSNGYLYASSNTAIYRYALNEDEEIIDTENPEKIVEGLIDMGRDNAKSFVIDNNSNIYVTIGSWNDACRDDETKTGIMPCTILDSAGGIWKFKADKLNQTYADGTRFATGLKNAVGTAWNFKTNSLFATVHGRGGLSTFYPELYTTKQNGELPAETLYELTENADAGWPYIYYDQFKKKKILSPEYGGDGEKTAGEDALDPIMAFPAHLGPNDLLFYTGKMFPAKYNNGAFIAFHNQSPELKKGFFVAFVPFENGKPSGEWEIFADNFAGIDLANPSGPVQHRPCGLAQGPKGELYVSDDLGGTLFKISYEK